MSDLPDGWEWVETGSVTQVQGGIQKQPKRKPVANKYPFLRVANVPRGRLDLSDVHEIELFDGEIERYRLHPGDLLVVEGNGSPDQIGRAAQWHGEIDDCVHQNHLIRVRPSAAIDPSYLTYYWNAPRTTQYLRSVASSTSGLHVLTASKVRSVRIPLPPLHKQKAIVAAVEEQFSRLDSGIAALRDAGRRLAQLRDRGILSLISGTGKKLRLGEVADIRLGRQRSPKDHVGPNMVPYLRAANVTWHGLELADVKEMNFSSAEVATYGLRPGDVLVAEASGSASEVGKPALWHEELPVCCFQNTLLRLRSEALLPDYLYYVILALARSGTFARASKGVGIHHLSKSGLASVMVEVPALEAQRELVAEIRFQQEYFDQLGAALDAGLQRAAVLRSSILSAAFTGRLTVQKAFA